MKFVLCHVLAIGCLVISGCGDKPADPPASASAAKPTIVGKWSAAAETAGIPTAMTFQESGTFQYKGPLWLRGRPAKVDGRSETATVIASGSWERNGNALHVQITQASDFRLAINIPWEYQVVSMTDKKLELKREGDEGESVTLVRER